jgi:hypothetical protein
VVMCSVCRKEVRCDQSADVNCVPLSDVIVCGTPNLAIQVEHSALTKAEAVMDPFRTAATPPPPRHEHGLFPFHAIQ